MKNLKERIERLEQLKQAADYFVYATKEQIDANTAYNEAKEAGADDYTYATKAEFVADKVYKASYQALLEYKVEVIALDAEYGAIGVEAYRTLLNKK